MDKFNDGFSDSSYEDLLNEYAGERLNGSSVRKNDVRLNGNEKSSVNKKSESFEKKTAVPQKRTPYNRQEAVKKAPPIDKYSHMDDDLFNANIDSKPKKATFDTCEIFSISKTEKKEKTNDDMLFGVPIIEKKYDSNNTRRARSLNDLPPVESPTLPPKKKPAVSNIKFDLTGTKSKMTQAGKMISEKGRSKIQSIRNKNSSDDGVDIKVRSNAPKGPKQKLTPEMIIAKIILFFKRNKKQAISFCCCVLVASIVSGMLISCVNDVLAINRDSETPVQVELPNNATTSDAIDVLEDAGLIKNKLFCKMFMGFMEAIDSRSGKKPKAYLPGVYYFTPNMGVEKMLSRFKTSAVRGATVSIVIPEGYTLDQVIAKLQKNRICSADALYKTVDEVDFSSEYDFINALTYKENRYHVLEGYIFPATYEFEQGADPATVIRTFLNQFQKRWKENYAERAAELSLSVDDVIKIASIIEKEAADKPQFDLVSSVLHNRLNRSGLYPTLDCDSTKTYVSNTISKRISSQSQISTYIRNYDTYTCSGLPASPICNPGNDAIEAALYPKNTQYYYFRHDKNKKIYMAKTLDEHNANGRTVDKINAQVERG